MLQPGGGVVVLVSHLLDLEAAEEIEGIRDMFALDCVDPGCAGDLREVERKLGVPHVKTSPKLRDDVAQQRLNIEEAKTASRNDDQVDGKEDLDYLSCWPVSGQKKSPSLVRIVAGRFLSSSRMPWQRLREQPRWRLCFWKWMCSKHSTINFF